MFFFWLWGRQGFTRQLENSKRAHLRVGHFKHHQNATSRPPRERKRAKAGEGKKARNCGPTFRCPTVRALPTFSRFGPSTLRAPLPPSPRYPPSGPHFFLGFGPLPLPQFFIFSFFHFFHFSFFVFFLYCFFFFFEFFTVSVFFSCFFFLKNHVFEHFLRCFQVGRERRG